MSDDDFKICVKSGLRRLLIGVESGSQEMMDWLKKDIKMEHVYLCADRCKSLGISVIFPFIVGFPEESDKSVDDTVKMALKLNKMHYNFSTPIFYFKPYPGTSITDNVVQSGYKLPKTTQEWSNFDYIGSSGPWVSNKKYKFFEKYKFYLKLGYTKQKWFFYPIQVLAKLRCRFNFYNFSLDKFIIDKLKKEQRLS